MAKKDANKKHYFQPASGEEADNILDRQVNDKSPVKIWQEGKHEKGVEEYICDSYNPQAKKLVFSTSGGFLSKLSSSKLVDKDVFIKIGEGKFQFFTFARLHYDKENKNYFVIVTHDIFRTQQRENYRLQANAHNKIQFKIAEGVVHDGLDISAGGTSFFVHVDEKDKYVKETIFENCTLRFNRKDFTIPKARVAGLWEQKDIEGNVTDELKIGLAFMELGKATEEALFKHINSEARAEEMRKKMAEQKKK